MPGLVLCAQAMSEPGQTKGGIPAWVLSGAAVAVVSTAVWWGTREAPKSGEAAKVSAAAAFESSALLKPAEVAGVGTGPQALDLAKTLLDRALEREKEGDLGAALVLARESASAGGGIDARLLEAKVLITQGEHVKARAPLEAILAEAPNNPHARYNMGLTWQVGPRPNYNHSRSAYLAALDADPGYAAARYNLAILCLEHGIAEEAKHHAEKFYRQFPHDARVKTLRDRIAKLPAGGRAQANPAPMPTAPKSAGN
jgi:tetratricopeptide (TPR) repeat protein